MSSLTDRSLLWAIAFNVVLWISMGLLLAYLSEGYGADCPRGSVSAAGIARCL